MIYQKNLSLSTSSKINILQHITYNMLIASLISICVSFFRLEEPNTRCLEYKTYFGTIVSYNLFK